MASVANATFLKIHGGHLGTVYGGCNISGDVGSLSADGEGCNIQMYGGTVHGDLFGGANGRYHCNDGTYYTDGINFTDKNYVGMAVPTHNLLNTTITGGTVLGNIYGGANMANVGFSAEYKGDKKGQVMIGHGLATLSIAATIPDVDYDDEPPAVYGNVFGGGNMASLYGRADLSVSAGYIKGAIYGGNDKTGSVMAFREYDEGTVASNGTKLSTTNAQCYVNITGKPQIGYVYGGGNGAYNYDDPNFLYCGDASTAKPMQSSVFVDIHTSGGYIDTVYGGGNGVSATNSVYLLVNTESVKNTDPYKHAFFPDRPDDVFVGSLFGGNNAEEMSIVPIIQLAKGTVRDVFGGGNEGVMSGGNLYKVTDGYIACDEEGDGITVGTYIKVSSADVTVTGSLYGGCKKAQVNNMAYVWVEETSQDGINRLFGGNDMSGYVGKTRIDVTGGVINEMYGGSNGKYAYGDGDDKPVYAYGHKDDAEYLLSASSKGIPNVGNSYVNVYGGVINSSIYGGGLFGDCDNTHVVVDDGGSCGKGDLEIHGTIFGGGCGNVDDLNATRYGNVTGTATTDLKQVHLLADAKAYGGGQAGNVANTVITTYPTWNKKLDALYGGCWGSDVTGTAHTVMNAKPEGTARNVDYLYGGNDFSGNVYNTLLEVNSGNYGMVFGAGNGAYDGDAYTTGAYASNNLSVPNSEYVKVVFKDGTVGGTLYGGGRLGTVMRKGYDKENTIYDAAADYARIEVDVHGGHFEDVFAGGMGAAGGKQIVYALKMLNMDGGEANGSIYGGSHNVHDGYPAECKARGDGTTTLRPSSIVNVTGGEVYGSVFGGGYLGNVFGSAYVNVGTQAVEDCSVWTAKINGEENAYAAYKPTLSRRNLFLESSVYGGANWGTGGESAFFNTPGFAGGMSHIRIDGEGYNTDVVSSNPTLNIKYSVIGSGTSAEGGDYGRKITIRNYGVYENCDVSRSLYSIQRADTLNCYNSAFELTGAMSAYSLYTTNNYSINMLKNVFMDGYNVLKLKAKADQVYRLVFREDDGVTITDEASVYHAMGDNATICGASLTECDRINGVVSPTVDGKKHTALYISGGYDFNIYDSVEAKYGSVEGYAYFISENETEAIVVARWKSSTRVIAEANRVNPNDGGFFAACNTDNSILEDPRYQSTDKELAYVNYANTYRVWGVGQGRRVRSTTIRAHSDVSKLVEDKPIRVRNASNTDDQVLALAKATLDLPPASPGSYYTINDGIIIDQANNELHLINASFNPNDWSTIEKPLPESGYTSGSWLTVSGTSDHVDGAKILESPANTYGLMIAPGTNFSSTPLVINYVDDDNNTQTRTSSTYSTLSGNNYYNKAYGYLTSAVEGAEGMIPTLDFYLTYSTNFSSTLIGDVTFTLMEYDASHNLVGPIDVTVTISTVVDKFIGGNYDLMAMFNDGRSNVYTRKVVLPASLSQRNLYLSHVRWEPCAADMHVTGKGTEENFLLTDDLSMLDNTHFGITITPTEYVTNKIATYLGWETASRSGEVDVFALAKEAHGAYAGNASAYSDKESGAYKAVDLRSAMNGDKGIMLGTLDGRAAAALDMKLNYNGNVIYEDGYFGRTILQFDYYVIKDEVEQLAGTFYDTLFVRSRENGDTIYVATATSLTRNGITLNQHSIGNTEDLTLYNDKLIGKRPNYYLPSIEEALDDNVYLEGDVISILDEVRVGGGGSESLLIKGTAYQPIPIIRYSGNHFDFPGEECAYRGTMIKVPATVPFTASNIEFDGSAFSKKKPYYTTRPAGYASLGEEHSWTVNPGTPQEATYYSYADDPTLYDTLMAFGPIFEVTNAGSVTLANNTVVANNWNGASVSEGVLGGAVHLANTATLALNYGVTMENNFTAQGVNTAAGHVATGAVHVDGGVVSLGPSSKETYVTLINNYLWDGTTQFWTVLPTGRLAPDETQLATLGKANVYLNRAPNSGSPVMKDDISKYINFREEIPDGTRIGISKWFPGPTERDTIFFGYCNTSQLYLQHAKSRGVFESDDPQYDIFFHPTVDTRHIYLHRCATFRHQIKAEGNNVYETALPQDSVITFRPNFTIACPTGGDTLTYRVNGGFYPYVYAWSREGVELLRDTTPYDNIEMYTNPEAGGYAKARATVSSHFLTPDEGLSLNEMSRTSHYMAEATDLAGCHLSKEVKINITKQSGVEPAWAYVDAAKWKDTADKVEANRQVGEVNRSYRTTQIAIEYVPNPSGAVSVIDPEGTEINGSLLSSYSFCYGDVLKLIATSDDDNRFVMWDFDPYDLREVSYAVPYANTTVTAYYGPSDYWKRVVNAETVKNPSGKDVAYYATTNTYAGPSDGQSYATTYDGDVHIYDEYGLAWFISVVNGLNGTQARDFFFNKVYLHQKPGNAPYDMKDHLWTPVGTPQHPFRGWFIATTSGATDTAALPAGQQVEVQHLIVNEPDMDNVGFFAYVDSAKVSGVKIGSGLFHGAQYVAAMSAHAVQSRFANCAVESHEDADATIITTHHTSGGFIATSERSTIKNSVVHAKFMGDGVYSGGLLGYGNADTASNNVVRNINRMEAVYQGGAVGYATAPARPNLLRRLLGTKDASDQRTYLANNYVQFVSSGRGQRVGGIVGYADRAVMENNYVYGSVTGSVADGAVAGVLESGAEVQNNYYAAGSASRVAGSSRRSAVVEGVSSFSGEGNRVELAERVYGVSNLTRVLNIWVRERNAEGADFLTWRSDLDHRNSGYPVFGMPDLIPVADTLLVENCDSLVFDGRLFVADDSLNLHVVDSVQMIDSTLRVRIVVHHAVATHLADTAAWGTDYEAYGFAFSAAESRMLRSSLDSLGRVTIQLSDTLYTAFGCDSVVTLSLTFQADSLQGIELDGLGTASRVSLYPNPTADVVNVEAERMSAVELYDNEGRRLQHHALRGDARTRLNLTGLPSGVYYVRVHTAGEVIINKVIKH